MFLTFRTRLAVLARGWVSRPKRRARPSVILVVQIELIDCLKNKAWWDINLRFSAGEMIQMFGANYRTLDIRSATVKQVSVAAAFLHSAAVYTLEEFAHGDAQTVGNFNKRLE
jgi:hypothetical protein